MKALILLPLVLALSACSEATSQSVSGGGSIYNGTDGSSITVVNEETNSTAPPSEECSVESRAEGVC